MELHLLVFLAIFVAAFVQGLTGFAFAMIAVSLLSLFVDDYLLVLAMVCIFGVAVTGLETFRYRNEVRWSILVVPSVAFIVCDVIGLRLVKYLPRAPWFFYLGLMLVGLSLFMAFFQRRLHVQPSLRNGLIAGSISGFGGGFFTVSGPPLVAYLLAVLGDNKMGYIATSQAAIFLMFVFDFSLRIAFGMVPLRVLALTPAGLCGVVCGIILGSRVLKIISVETMRLFIYALMFVNGVVLMLK